MAIDSVPSQFPFLYFPPGWAPSMTKRPWYHHDEKTQLSSSRTVTASLQQTPLQKDCAQHSHRLKPRWGGKTPVTKIKPQANLDCNWTMPRIFLCTSRKNAGCHPTLCQAWTLILFMTCSISGFGVVFFLLFFLFAKFSKGLKMLRHRDTNGAITIHNN